MERDSVNFIDWWSRASHIWTKSYNSVALTRQTWRQRKLICVQKRFLSRKVHWFVCRDEQPLPSAVVDVDFLNRGLAWWVYFCFRSLLSSDVSKYSYNFLGEMGVLLFIFPLLNYATPLWTLSNAKTTHSHFVAWFFW